MALKKVAKRTKKKAVAKRTATRSSGSYSLICCGCGREVIVQDYIIPESTIYCCGTPMKKK